jgi:hypothetical protein
MTGGIGCHSPGIRQKGRPSPPKRGLAPLTNVRKLLFPILKKYENSYITLQSGVKGCNLLAFVCPDPIHPHKLDRRQ